MQRLRTSPVVLLAREEFRTRFTGNAFVFIWAFVQPAITLSVLHLVISRGLKGAEPSGSVSPFFHTAAALLLWFFIAETLNFGATCFVDYRFALRRDAFPLGQIPWIRTLSGLYVHGVLLGTLMLFLALKHGLPVTVVQLPILIAGAALLACKLIQLTGSLFPYFRDVQHATVAIVQLGMWVTPIAWDPTVIP